MLIPVAAQLKLKFYYSLIMDQIYAEGESPYHQQITLDVIDRYIDPLQLDKQCRILDLGCGAGYFLKAMRDRGFADVSGITLSADDLAACERQGLAVECRDMNLLTDRNESVDLLFSRHSLEHSPFPYFTLIEYNRVLRNNGYLYVEVPQPGCDRPHETNRNHYSIMERSMWLSLLQRTGFDVSWYDYEFDIDMVDGRRCRESYYIFVCRRRRALDMK